MFGPRTGERLLEVAAEHIGERYIFGARAPLTNPNHKGPWDCAEFTSWVTYQVGKLVFGAEPMSDPDIADAYTGYWYNHAKHGQAIIEVQRAIKIPGAVLLRRPSSAVRGHVAFSDGVGGTIEAYSAKHGVCRASAEKNREWHFGVLLPGFTFTE